MTLNEARVQTERLSEEACLPLPATRVQRHSEAARAHPLVCEKPTTSSVHLTTATLLHRIVRAHLTLSPFTQTFFLEQVPQTILSDSAENTGGAPCGMIWRFANEPHPAKCVSVHTSRRRPRTV